VVFGGRRRELDRQAHLEAAGMTDLAIVSAAIAIAAFACAFAYEFWAWWFRRRNRRDNERWLRSNQSYFTDMDAELEEILRG
jgi:hypothetical protein